METAQDIFGGVTSVDRVFCKIKDDKIFWRIKISVKWEMDNKYLKSGVSSVWLIFCLVTWSSSFVPPPCESLCGLWGPGS